MIFNHEVDFCEFRWAQLAKSTFPTSTLVPLESFQDLLISVQMLTREWGAESNRKLFTYSDPGKTAAWVPEFTGKSCLRQNYNLGSCAYSEEPILGHKTLMMMMILDGDRTRDIGILEENTKNLIPKTT